MLITNFGFGGAQRSFSKISLELAKKHNVYVVVFNDLAEHIYPHGGKVFSLDVKGGTSIIDKASKFLERIKAVKKLKHKLDIDVSLSFLEGADYVNLLSKGREKVIISIRGSKMADAEISGLFGILRKKVLMPLLYKKADTIVALSESIKRELTDHFGINQDKVETIYNFFDVDAFKELASEPLEEKFGCIFESPVIINTGRLHIQKQQLGLIKVFAALPASVNHKLVIIGDGGLLPMLTKESEELGLRTYVHGSKMPINGDYHVYFLGYQENPFKFMNKAKIFAFTSSWEGFGNVIIEAMISGLPVITTDCPSGPREILAPDTNVPLPTMKPEFASFGVLMPLLNDPADKESIAIWSKTLDNLLFDTVTLTHYRKMAAERIEYYRTEKIIDSWFKVVEC